MREVTDLLAESLTADPSLGQSSAGYQRRCFVFFGRQPVPPQALAGCWNRGAAAEWIDHQIPRLGQPRQQITGFSLSLSPIVVLLLGSVPLNHVC